MSDDLGDRIKGYEALSTARRAFKGQPIISRLDGKNFHSFTRGLNRPYDDGLSKLMVSVTQQLVDQFGAKIGYTQSDEITLAWYLDSDSEAEYIFGGRFQKFDSLLAAACTAIFNRDLQTYLPTKGAELPIFDCRTFVVPNLLEAYHAILWRQQDCTKNAISMAAQSLFSHKELQGLKGPDMVQKMAQEKGVDFDQYPSFFRLGTFVRKVKVFKPMDNDLKLRLSAKGVMVPTSPIERSEFRTHSVLLGALPNPVSFLFHGEHLLTPDDGRAAPGKSIVG